MVLKNLKVGQEVWVHNGEFPVKESIIEIDDKKKEVWLSDGHPYPPTDIFPTKKQCKTHN